MKTKLFFIAFLLLGSVYAQNWQYNLYGGFSDGGAAAPDIEIAPNNNNIYVAFKDEFGNANKLSVYRSNGFAWQSIGLPRFSGAEINSPNLEIASNGYLYVAYSDQANFWGATVQKYNGSSWVNVGPNITNTLTQPISLEIDNNDSIYVAYSLATDSSKLTVVKFNGTTWDTVGNPSFTQGQATYTSLKSNSLGELYVAFTDNLYGNYVSVMKLSGNTWTYVGSRGFSNTPGIYIDLEFNNLDEPVVIFRSQVSQKASTMYFRNGVWQYIGGVDFTPAPVGGASLAINKCGSIYAAVTLSNFPYNNRAYFMELKSDSTWTIPEQVSVNYAYNVDIELSEQGQAFYGFRDYDLSNKMSVMERACNYGTAYIADTACNSYISPSGRYVWTLSGIYFDTLFCATSTGCDSLMYIDLHIDTINTGVSQVGFTLTVDSIADSYQWLDCDNSYAIISGENSQSFTATTSGNYAVELITNGCSDTSACFNINTVGFLLNKEEVVFKIYPNPVKDILTIISDKNETFEIRNVTGQFIKEFNINGTGRVDISHLKPGIYFISSQYDSRKMSRIIKK